MQEKLTSPGPSASARCCPAHAPSDLEKAEAQMRAREGIPLDPVTWREFQALGQRYGCSIEHFEAA